MQAKHKRIKDSKINLNQKLEEGIQKTQLWAPKMIEIFENSGPIPGFDLLTWAGFWVCSQ